MKTQLQKYYLPRSPWYGGGEVEVCFPSRWDVSYLDIPADKYTPLTRGEIAERLFTPVDSMPLHRLARGKKKAVIIFDDLSRPTDVAAVAPLVVDALLQAGLTENEISFVVALGAHGAQNLSDFTKKLGADVVNRFPVYNHNPYENCSFAGETTSGVPVYINDEVLSADLKIGIGSVLPHTFNGFGGGGKLLFPGVAGMESIYQNHHKVINDLKNRGAGMLGIIGQPELSAMQLDLDETMAMLDFNFLVNLLPDSKGRSVEIVAGDPVAAYRKGVEQARKFYLTDFHGDADLVVANACAKVNEALNGLLLGAESLKESGGDAVIVADCPVGQVFHYLLGRCGQNTGGRLWPGGDICPPRVKRGFLFSTYPGQRFGFFSSFKECRSWDEIINLLQNDYGEKARVVIYRDATLQYFRRQI